MAREVGAVSRGTGGDMEPGLLVIVLAVVLGLPYLVFWLPQHLIQGRHPVVIGNYRGCDLVRGYDQQRGQSFYFTDCSPDRVGARGSLPHARRSPGGD